MKRKLIGVMLVTVLIASAAAVVWADTRSWVGRGWSGRHWGGPLNFAARELDLSDAQRQQIAAMWQAERPEVAALIHDFANESAAMSAAERNGANDDRMKEIAAQQGATVAKLLLEKEHLRSRIYTQVLNAAQRSKADEMEKRWQSRMQWLAGRLTADNAQTDGGELCGL